MCVQRSPTHFSVSHAAPPHNNMGKEESCAFPATSYMSNATSLCCFGGSIITKTSLNISNRIVHTIFNTEAKEKVISGYMGIHLNSSLIHPKRSIWPHPNGLRLSGTALHMVNISPWCAWGTPDAFVLRLFSSCVKVQRTKTYLWRVEYTQWAHSQQLNPTGSHS